MSKLSTPQEARQHTIAIRGIDPMVVIRQKDVYERLENAIDACDDVAHTLEGLRHAI